MRRDYITELNLIGIRLNELMIWIREYHSQASFTMFDTNLILWIMLKEMIGNQ